MLCNLYWQIISLNVKQYQTRVFCFVYFTIIKCVTLIPILTARFCILKLDHRLLFRYIYTAQTFKTAPNKKTMTREGEISERLLPLSMTSRITSIK